MVEVENRVRPIQLKFRVDESELKKIKERMEEAEIPVFSLFARQMLVMGEVRVIEFSALKQLRLEINKIGVNINQIAKRVNENDKASRSDIQECQEQLEDLRQVINTLIQSEVRREEKGKRL